ncbi:AfsR/SARP family transcriptional regulator [Lentzea flava]|uniref:SARP family transcriptional regulator n=1 Tax=Lentzea flava TaxID=103732 RepID=A0ABQ2UDY0_9PSEU|nr:BTAD domain-containing putative transcriptional regulator [Lentzea flava]MCP2198342.1 DNA-binding transcriptional activator of the SARP family [Lentzea flava]GGU25162.1 SARP family transcriptional regulator [Lentzea flava]
MDFGILGPIQARDSGVRLELGGVRGQKVLAALLLAPNRVVPLTHLVDVVWDGEPPSTGKHQIQKSVGDLRAALGVPGMIVTDGPGYRIVLGSATLDVITFERHVATAQTVEPAEAVRLLRTALALWRGPALAGLNGQVLRVEAERLDERRIAVAQQCFALQLELGQHEQVITELSALVAANPFREQLVEQLMIALYRSNRQADALELYDRTRRLLADELGVDPGRSLRAAHQAILNQDSETVHVTQKAPAQLPADLARFTGRKSSLDELDAGLAQSTVMITVISGTAGVGKTALAVHWAHRVRDRFPDGQLYLNLRGFDDAPATTPAEALTQLLRGLGVEPDRIPGEADEQASVLRSVLANRRVLILLDNAANEDQVRPLLPGAPGCAVIITSRNDLRGLTALDDARRVELDLLTPDEAQTLIHRVLGAARGGAEPEAVADLAALCGHLPLAIRIAAANLACRPHDKIADAVADLARGDRLAQLAISGDRRAAVTGAFELSLKSLPAEAALLFRRLGLLPRNDFTAHTASVLMGGDDVRPLVAALESASLIEPHTRGRFRVHDLLHLYARELAASDEDAGKTGLRLLDHYLHTTDAALDVLAPHMYRLGRDGSPGFAFDSREAALSWLDGEWESVAACALRAEPVRYRWQLADSSRRLWYLRQRFDVWHETSSAGLAAAERCDDLRGRAAMHLSLGTVHCELDGRQGIGHLETALAFYGELGDRDGKFHCLNNLAVLHLAVGRTQEAVELLREALPLADDNPCLSAAVHHNLGVASAQSGRLSEAVEHHERPRSGGSDALVELALGELHALLGDPERAREHVERGARLAEESGSQAWRYVSQTVAAKVDRDTGRTQRALARALALIDEAEEDMAELYVLHGLVIAGSAHHRLGRPQEAIEALRRGLRLAGSLGRVENETECQIELARVLRSAELAERALDQATAFGFRRQRGRALATLAWLSLVEAGDEERASGCAREAVEVQRETGFALGEAEALLVLARAERDPAYLREMRAIVARMTGPRGGDPAGVLCETDFG